MTHSNDLVMTVAGQAVVVEVAAEAEAVVVVVIVVEMTVVSIAEIRTVHRNPEEVVTEATHLGVMPTRVIVNGETVNPRTAGVRLTAVGDHRQIDGEIGHHHVVAETKEEIIFGTWTVIGIEVETVAVMAAVEVVAAVAVVEAEAAEEADLEAATVKIGGRMPIDQADEAVDEMGDAVTMTPDGVAEPQETNRLLGPHSPVYKIHRRGRDGVDRHPKVVIDGVPSLRPVVEAAGAGQLRPNPQVVEAPGEQSHQLDRVAATPGDHQVAARQRQDLPKNQVADGGVPRQVGIKKITVGVILHQEATRRKRAGAVRRQPLKALRHLVVGEKLTVSIISAL